MNFSQEEFGFVWGSFESLWSRMISGIKNEIPDFSTYLFRFLIEQ